MASRRRREFSPSRSGIAVLVVASFVSGRLLADDREILRYDFGAASIPAAPDFTRLTIDHTYDKQRGFGLVPSSDSKNERGSRQRRLVEDHRLDTFVFDDGGTTFLHDLPNGTYFVSLATGDAAYASETSVTLNGVSLQLLTPTQRGEFVRVNGARVRVTTGQLQVEIGSWGQLCYLEIVPEQTPQGMALRASERTRKLVERIATSRNSKTDADNEAQWVCIGPFHFPEKGIWVAPAYDAVKAGREEIPFGWDLYLHLPDDGQPPPLNHTVLMDLTKTKGTAGRRERIEARRIRLEYRRVFQSRPYHHFAYEAIVRLVEPFQTRFERAEDVTFGLSARVEDENGNVVNSHSIRFANRPTYLLTDIVLPKRGMDLGTLGTRSKVNIGDLTGDGHCDFLFCIGAGFKVAYEHTGRELWRYENSSEPIVYNSMATRVFDIDSDGHSEVICLQDGELRILNGVDGSVRRAVRWPDVNGRPMALEARLFFADLRGQGVRDILVLNGIASDPDVRITALTDDLQFLWTAAGFSENGAVGSHALNVADVDADGKDEVAFGTSMLDDDGTVLWRLPYTPWFSQGGGDTDHVDEAEIGDLDGDGRLEIFYASGTLLDARTGKPRFTSLPEIKDGQWTRIDRVRLDRPGKQLLLANKWSPPRLFDGEGTELDWPFPFASWDLVDWDGDGQTEVMGGGLICDRRGVVVGVCDPRWTMPRYADVTGNGRDEVAPWCLDMHGQQIRVFGSAPRPANRLRPLTIRRRHYNFRD